MYVPNSGIGDHLGEHIEKGHRVLLMIIMWAYTESFKASCNNPSVNQFRWAGIWLGVEANHLHSMSHPKHEAEEAESTMIPSYAENTSHKWIFT